ncbi:MAG: helical backbone metal receptor [Candidatus Binatia bacterium]
MSRQGGGAPRRLVCLVPSITELLFALGAGGSLVGRTRYCEEPAGRVETVETVGGTKNPDCERIIGLMPDLVIVNREENRVEDFRRLQNAGLRVLVTHPRTVAQAADMIEAVGNAVQAAGAARSLAAQCRAMLGGPPGPSVTAPVRVFCPIWRRPWMTFGSHTYVADVLRQAGMESVYDGSEGPDFFEVELADVRARRPELVLLPDEPYRFRSEHAEELRGGGLEARYELLDGKDLAWYGPRIPGALERLAKLCSG